MLNPPDIVGHGRGGLINFCLCFLFRQPKNETILRVFPGVGSDGDSHGHRIVPFLEN